MQSVIDLHFNIGVVGSKKPCRRAQPSCHQTFREPEIMLMLLLRVRLTTLQLINQDKAVRSAGEGSEREA